jgi:hypothetical protein
MIDNVISIVVIIGIGMVTLVVSVAVRLLWDRLIQPSREKLAEYSRQFAERLQNPDLPAVEEHFGYPLPPSVQMLYANRRELLRQDFEVATVPDADSARRWYVAFYQPADRESARDTWPGLEKYFAFANDGCGNEYLLDPREDNPPVLFHDHETGELSRVCDHFSEFMDWPRLRASS